MVFWVGGFYWVSTRGTRVTSAEAPILVTASHSTYFDGLLVTFLDLTTVVAKKSSEHIPFFGSMCPYRELGGGVRRESPWVLVAVVVVIGFVLKFKELKI